MRGSFHLSSYNETAIVVPETFNEMGKGELSHLINFKGACLFFSMPGGSMPSDPIDYYCHI